MIEGYPNLNDLGRTSLVVTPGDDRILFYDVSAGVWTYLTPGTGLSISGTSLAVGGLTVGQFASANISQWTNNVGYLTSFTESDPIFLASPAAGISGWMISNWNTAFGWGNHASAGYLTSVADATTSTKGIASFDAADFNVTAGAVELEDTVVKTITTPSGSLTPSAHGFTLNATSATGVQVSHTGTTISVAGINASTSTKGVASFNSTNFTASSGAINTIQNIHTTATPTFAGLTITGLSGVLKAATGVISASATTSDLPEGTNLYWTQARFDTALAAANVVAKSLYDAHTILQATSDNTPVALTVPEQTFVGRKTGSNIIALTAAEGRTILNVADGATNNTKATGAELDTGTDDAKFATAKAIEDSTTIPKGTPGAQYNVLASNGTNWTVQALTTILAALRPLDIQFYDASDTWNKPTGAVFVIPMLIGGGGGGGSGRRSSTTAFGGEGGSPGGCVIDIVDASLLASSEAVTIGAGGNGGASKTATGDGNAGTSGSETVFAHLSAGGGRNGRGGTASGPTSTPITPPLLNGGTSLVAIKAVIYTSGGAIPAPDGGHVGGGDHGSGSTTGGAQGGAGAAGAGGVNSDPGEDGLSSPSGSMAGGSGGGGGFSAGSAGGAGGTPGGGGGGGAHGDAGGGAGDDSGAGGAGGDGRAVIITFGY